jgi:ATP phosphoribosyltransferase regulatory subunit
MAGGAVEPSTVIQLQDREGEFLGLRPELTASIARAAVNRLVGASYPQRLYYNANVFRQAERGTRQHEFYQAGIELLGAGNLAADAEILLLLFDCLHNLGLNSDLEAGLNSAVILGEAGLTRSLLSIFPEALRPAVRHAIAHLDRIALENLPLTPELRDRALLLLDLRGQPMDVLQQVSQLDLADDQQVVVSRLKDLIDLIEASQAQRDWKFPTLILDLSLIQTFDYYTGIVFEAVSAQRVLGQGGRYDQLLGLYHPKGETQPGIGFVLNIEELHQVLLPTGCLPAKTPASDWLVVPTSPHAYAAAFSYAQALRSATELVRVEVDLGDRANPEEIRIYAEQRHIQKIVWIDPEGAVQIEAVDRK